MGTQRWGRVDATLTSRMLSCAAHEEHRSILAILNSSCHNLLEGRVIGASYKQAVPLFAKSSNDISAIQLRLSDSRCEYSAGKCTFAAIAPNIHSALATKAESRIIPDYLQ